MTEFEQQILGIIQDGFPIVDRPYAAIADSMNRSAVLRYADDASHRMASEKLVFDAVDSLRNSGVIRRLGGVYDSRRLGFVGRLCTGKVPSVALGAADDSALDAFAEAVLKIPAITHNYVRSHEYNVWFTIIAENEQAVQNVLDRLCAETALHDVHSMPARRMFKINTVMVRQAHQPDNQPDSSAKPAPVVEVFTPSGSVESLSNEDRSRIYKLSGDIPHTLTPFADLMVDLEGVRQDLSSKRMRRFGAVLRHQQAGYPCNAMVCFDTESVSVDVATAGTMLASNPYVSHCYERPPFEGFPYNVYAMFHAQNSDELNAVVNKAVKNLGSPKSVVLHSLRELKKTSYRYFEE